MDGQTRYPHYAFILIILCIEHIKIRTLYTLLEQDELSYSVIHPVTISCRRGFFFCTVVISVEHFSQNFLRESASRFTAAVMPLLT